ncbi:MAG: AEC family transporter [Bullifex sp.]
MHEIIVRAVSFFLIVVLAYLLKRAGVFTREDGFTLSRIVMKITLPCAIITSFSSGGFSGLMLIFILFGLGMNLLLLGIAFLMCRGKGRNDKIYYLLSVPAYNIGAFTLPFASGMMGPVSALTVCMFDAGNAFQCVGFDYAIAKAAVDGDGRLNPLGAIKTVLKVPTFDCYLIFITLSLLRIHIPSEIFTFTSIVGSANGPLAMIMIGLMVELKFDKDSSVKAISVLLVRYLAAALMAYIFYSFLPFSHEIRKGLAIVLFSPISSAAPSFTMDLKGDTALAGMVNSLSIVISIIAIPLLVILL